MKEKETTNCREEYILKQVENILAELNVINKSSGRHFNVFEFRGEEIVISKETLGTPERKKLGTTILGAGLGALVAGRVVKKFLGNQGAIVGTILGSLIGGLVASKITKCPCMEKEVITEEKQHPVITVKEALESLKNGKGFYITEQHKIEAEDGAVYDVTHWTKFTSIDDLISFYNIETGKPPRNDLERIGQLMDKFDYKLLTDDGSTFYHAEGAPFTDAKKILEGKGVNIRKYKQFRKEIINRDSKGNITGYSYEDSGEVLVTDKVSTEKELEYLISHY